MSDVLKRSLTLAVLITVGCMGTLRAAPPESRRFDDEAFRKGLQARGLTELLEPFLEEFPPGDPTEAAILSHDLKVREFHDESRADADRQAALREAQRLLEMLIERNPADLRRFGWRMELARSLVYDLGEPGALRILYRGGTAADREELLPVMQHAARVLQELISAVQSEDARLDQLSPHEYERLERSGHVERIENMGPQAEYVLAWVHFFSSIVRKPQAPERTGDLHEVMAYLTQHSELLDTPHENTHYQAQALLLSGLTQHALGDTAAALASLNNAINIIARLPDEGEKHDLRWAAVLAGIERIRVLADRGEFDRAFADMQELRQQTVGSAPGTQDRAALSMELTLAWLDGGLRQAQAEQARKSGDEAGARRFAAQSRAALLALARRNAETRREVYALLFPLVRDALKPGSQVSPGALHPLDQCALIAGLLTEAETAAAQAGAGSALPVAARTGFERVVTLGQGMLGNAANLDEELAPELIYNVAVAHYRLGQKAEAARRFLDASRNYAHFERAESAAGLAVQLANELRLRASSANQASAGSDQQLYLDALTHLISRFPTSSAAKYWKYFLAEALENQGRYEEAARRFDEIPPEHEHYLEARFHLAQCRMNDLLRSVAPPGRPASRPARNDAVPITQRADEIARLLNDFIEAARQRLALPAAGTESQPARDETLRRLVPLAEIMKAELNTLPGADRAADALQTLAGFEERYGTAGPYAARVLRARLAAYQQLGRIDEAARIIPQYVNADPAHAGPLLQSLYEPLVADYERAARENSPAAQSRAETALLIARQLVQWSQRSDARVAEQDRYAFRVQLGESLLRAGKLDEAKAEFAACLALDAKRNADGKPHDARVLFGHAEAAYRAGNYEAALPEFNQAFRRAPDGDPLWWRALLRDLQCRTALQGDPNDILKVIRQQRTRHPDLGGEAFKRDFDALFEENTKRLGH